MDRQAQLKRLVWLSTTTDKPRKVYAWQEAQALDRDYPGISAELAAHMTGQGASSASGSHTQPKLPLAGAK